VPQVSYDWSSGIYGLSLDRHRSLGSLLVQHKLRLREEAERRRVLYVGMTRAKELLLLSGGITGRSVGETVFDLLQNIGTGEIGTASTEALTIGASAIPHRVIKAPERKRPRRRSDRTASEVLINPEEIAERWEVRTARWTEVCETSHHLTPTTLGKRLARVVGETTPVQQDAAVGRLVGVVAHRLLERWDFSQDPSRLCAQVVLAVQATLGPDDQPHAETVAESVTDLLATFGRSEAYERLRSSQILGREVPFVMPWGDRQVMEGVIDLLYRLDGELWVVDYKTDAISADQAVARAEQYRTQSEVYKVAVQQSLGVESVRFHCLFLRCAMAVEL
jgi:ATP-dependent helicase/nuclease subunit A